jgi:serine phosphatase RsbU (regulator of sigma subunit)
MAITSTSPFGFKGWKDKSGTPWLGSYSQTSSKSLTAVVFTDGSAAYQSTKKLILRSALWTMLLVLVGIMLSYITASRVSKKLIEISNATQQIAQGNFKVRLASTSDDEIGALAISVENMAFQIVNLLGEQVEKARMARELETATTIQNTFFAKSNYNTRHLKIGSKFRPATECGGDWWGHFPINDRLHLICIADATGHGVPAALITAIAYSASTLLATFYSKGGGFEGSMAGILTELNQLLCRLGSGNMTLTFFAALIDVEQEKMFFSNAGHNFPILIPEASGESRFNNDQSEFILKRHQVSLSSPGCPLGLIAEGKFIEHSIPIKQGDKILFYTDGLIECTDRKNAPWGRRKLGKLIETLHESSMEELHTAIVDQSFAHFGQQPLADDVTIVTIEIGSKEKISEPVEFDLSTPTVA